MTPPKKLNAKLHHRIVTLSGLGALTQREIQGRVKEVSRVTISRACAPYRQKKMDKEELFTNADVRMMTGIKHQRTIKRMAKKHNLGTKMARYTVYTKADVDTLCQLLAPPPGCLTGGEVGGLFRVSRETLADWTRYLDLKPERRFGVLWFSKADVQAIRDSLALAKLGLTLKRLSYHSGASYSVVVNFCNKKALGQFALNRHGPRTRFLAQGEYDSALAALAARAAPRLSRPSSRPSGSAPSSAHSQRASGSVPESPAAAQGSLPSAPRHSSSS